MSPRTPALRRRPARVIPSILVCLAILLPVGYLVWASVIRFSQGTWPGPVATGAPAVLETPLSHPGVLIASIIAVVVGIVLILCALIPGGYRSNRLHIDEDLYSGPQESVLTHHGLANIVRTRTSRLDGVETVSAEVTDRRAALNVRTPLHEAGEVTERVRAVAEDAVGRIPFHRPPSVTARSTRSR